MTVNQDILKGQWQQLKGTVRAQWGKLTDDDVEKIQGNAEVLLGKLQERYGRKREEVEAEVNQWLADGRAPKAEKEKVIHVS